MPFPIIYLMVFLSTNLMHTCDGNEEMNYKVNEILDKRKNQDERKGNLGKFQMKRRKSFVVTPPFEHKVVTFSKNSVEKGVLLVNKNDSVAQPEVRYTEINDSKRYDNEANMYGNDYYEDVYNKNIDNIAPYNISDEYPSHNRMEDLMHVLSKQNKLVEQLVELFRNEISNKRVDKLVESINKKQYMQFFKNAGINCGNADGNENQPCRN